MRQINNEQLANSASTVAIEQCKSIKNSAVDSM